MATRRGTKKPIGRPTTSLQTGRVQQKLRTRDSLVDAAIKFIRSGRDYSVADVADAAKVARATAYYYFATKESLHSQAILKFVATTDYPAFDDVFRRTPGVAARLRALVEASDTSIRKHEAQYRALLRSSLDEHHGVKLPRRPPQRRQWLTEALEPLRASTNRVSFDRLVGALSLCMGIEAEITLRDVCGFTASEARAIKTWAASSLLAAAMPSTKKKATGEVDIG